MSLQKFYNIALCSETLAETNAAPIVFCVVKWKINVSSGIDFLCLIKFSPIQIEFRPQKTFTRAQNQCAINHQIAFHLKHHF